MRTLHLEKSAQEQLRARMRDQRTTWETAQRNLTWGEQNGGKARPADRVHEQTRKWRSQGGG
jgi:hypothetical protein